MRYLKKFQSSEDALGKVIETPNICKIGSKLHFKGGKTTSKATFENTVDGDVKEMNFKAVLTCSEDTTLPVWFTEAEHTAGTPSETLNLAAGENVVEYPHSIFRMGIITYDPSTKKRSGGNDKITGLKLSGVWRDGYRMFDNAGLAHSMVNLDLTDLDTSQMTTLFCAFQRGLSLTSIGDLHKWDVSHVTDMTGTFSYCTGLTSMGDLSRWDVSNVTSMIQAFNNVPQISSFGNLGNWNVSKVTDMSYAFNRCLGITSLGNLSKWDVSHVTNMEQTFGGGDQNTGAGKLSDSFVAGLANWDMSNVTNMTCMFYGQGSASVYPFENWNVGNCTSFNHMFCDNYSLKKVDMTNWDTSNLLTCYNMFNDCAKLSDIGNISGWNVEKLIDAGSFLTRCYSLAGKLDLSGWNTPALRNTKSMFVSCSGITELDLNSLITSGINSTAWEGKGEGIHYADDEDDDTMKYMFKGCTNLALINVGSGWQTSQTDITGMFSNCGTDHVTVV